MASQAAANALTNLARAAVGIGFAGSALSASMYDGACSNPRAAEKTTLEELAPALRRRGSRLARDASSADLGFPNLPFFAVDGGHSAVMFDRFRGVLPKAIGEGTHFPHPVRAEPHRLRHPHLP